MNVNHQYSKALRYTRLKVPFYTASVYGEGPCSRRR